MKRRAKLSLVADEGADVKAPPDFGSHAASDTAPASRRSGASARVARAKAAGFDAKRAAKVLLVVAVGALSLYLLKRRFL